MKTRDRKRRPRGGPNPGRLIKADRRFYYLGSIRDWYLALLWARAERPEDYGPLLNRARRYMAPKRFRYVRIRLKEASR